MSREREVMLTLRPVVGDALVVIAGSFSAVTSGVVVRAVAISADSDHKSG
jgi:hypothetical protein